MLAQFRPPKPCGPGLDAEPTNCLLESDRRSALQRQDEPDKGRIPSRGSKKGNHFKGKGTTKSKKNDAKLASNSNKIKAHRGKRAKKDESKSTCFNCKKKGHFAHNCTELNRKVIPNPKFVIVCVCLHIHVAHTSENWIVDTKATKHVTQDKKGFENYQRFPSKSHWCTWVKEVVQKLWELVRIDFN
ncbi:hypothetical protein TB2_008991 [Malus domestica]